MSDEDDVYSDRELKSSPRRNECPRYCSMFRCTIDTKTGTCREECKKLDLTNSLICELCEEDCSKERKMILLDTKYFDHMKSKKTDDSSKRVDGVKTKHTAMEMRLQEIRDEFHSTPNWKTWVRGALKVKSANLRAKIEIYREVMDELGIQYDANVEI